MKKITREQYERMADIIVNTFGAESAPKLLTEGKYKNKNKTIINKMLFPLLKILVLENKSADILSVKNKDSVYYLEKAGNQYYVRREMPNETEYYTARTVLTPQDLKVFKDLSKPTKTELKHLGNKLEHEESRFGI